jgi:hypothetical protein
MRRAERRGECRGSRSACADLDGTNASGLWPLAAPKPACASLETRLAFVASKPAQAGLEPRHSLPSGDRPTYSSDEGQS